MRCAGQYGFGQRVTTSPSSRSASVPHTGQWVGISQAISLPSRASTTALTTSGMTSPARWRTTVSPTRRSLRRISSMLWRVALRTVVPPTTTGVTWATGVIAPVRPT